MATLPAPLIISDVEICDLLLVLAVVELGSSGLRGPQRDWPYVHKAIASAIRLPLCIEDTPFSQHGDGCVREWIDLSTGVFRRASPEC